MSGLVALGRVLLGGFFVLAGLSKLLDPSAPVGMMAEQGFPAPGLLVWPVIALEMVGGALVAWGRRWLAPTVLALAAFTLATNLGFHRFWEMPDPVMRQLELSLFFKNLAIMGGLLLLLPAPAKGRPTG